MKQHFRPEFLNRIDEAVVFHALDARHIEQIAKIQLQVLEARLEKMEMKLEVSPAALAELAKAGFDPVFGARPLKREIQRQIENPVAKLILEGRFGPKDVIPVDFRMASSSSNASCTESSRDRDPRLSPWLGSAGEGTLLERAVRPFRVTPSRCR